MKNCIVEITKYFLLSNFFGTSYDLICVYIYIYSYFVLVPTAFIRTWVFNSRFPLPIVLEMHLVTNRS